MKKYFPIFIPISVVFLALVNFILRSHDIEAGPTQAGSNKYAHFESELLKVKGKTHSGEVIDLAAIKSPITVLNFWASWCNPCVQEFSSLNKFIEKYSSKVRVIGINADEEEPLNDIPKIEKRYQLKFPTVIDEKNAISEKFGVELLPFSIVYVKNKVIWVSEKKMDYMGKDFLKTLEEELSK